MTQRPPSIAEIRSLLDAASGIRLARLIEQYCADPRAGVAAACRSAQLRLAAERAESTRLSRLYRLERDLRAQGFVAIAGADEVGRGALAGPVSVGAVILPERPRIEGLDDSKRLTPQRREEIALQVKEVAICFSIAHIPAHRIDAIGMGKALREAFSAALDGLSVRPDHVVIDGLPLRIAENETAVVKGDSRVAAVAAASVIAKVARDALMVAFAAEHPDFGFDENKGYGTPEHLRALADLGPCPQHRRSFTPGGGTRTLF